MSRLGPGSVYYCRSPVIPRRWHVMIATVTFCGWHAHHAAASPWGIILGLSARVHIEWRDLHGMQWCHLCRVVAVSWFPPDKLVIHLDGNYLARHSRKALTLDMLHDLACLKAKYLAKSIVWSTIIPQLAWRGAQNFFPYNTACRSVNREICRVVYSSLESVIGH